MEKFLDALGATALLVTMAVMIWLAEKIDVAQWMLKQFS